MSIFYWINFPLQYFNFTKITRISRRRILRAKKKRNKNKWKTQNKNSKQTENLHNSAAHCTLIEQGKLGRCSFPSSLPLPNPRKWKTTWKEVMSPPYLTIAQLRKQDESKIKKVLVLGAGYVTAGLINLLLQDSDTHITIALQLLEEAEKFASIANIKAVELNILENIPRTMELIQSHEVVISIFRQFFHTQIGEVCIKYKRNMLTAS